MVSKMRERLRQLAGEDEQSGREPNPKICLWCANRGGEACLAQCQREGKYRHLAPERRPDWETPPKLPPMRELVAWPAAERLAILWLVVHYQGEEQEQ